ncbi:MAG: hypothetical protein M3Z85_02620, partial [Acidobacteriota bacterium]|nr:hypothetical protein [Acidobacteriota bacterium]
MDNAHDGLKWLVDQWTLKLAGILESMTDQRPEAIWKATSLEDGDSAKIPENSLVWRQILSLSPEPAVWIAAPEPVWRDLGGRALQAGGARNTWLEVVNRSVTALVPELSRRARREIVCEKGEETPEAPPNLRFIPVEVSYAAERLRLFIAFSPQLIEAAGTSGESEVLGDDLIP